MNYILTRLKWIWHGCNEFRIDGMAFHGGLKVNNITFTSNGTYYINNVRYSIKNSIFSDKIKE